MNKRGWILWVSIALVVVLIGAAFLYFALFNRDNSSVYSGGNIKNPAEGLSNEEAVLAFNESFVFYLLYEIKAYNLHNPPFSSDVPRIEVDVGEDVFGATVDNGIITVTKGRIAKRDIIITTTKSEAVKMLRDKNYVVQSFNDKMSSIELVADKTTLFAKGYLAMYNELTGKSVTGNIVRIFTD
jgi:hypothetical protein